MAPKAASSGREGSVSSYGASSEGSSAGSATSIGGLRDAEGGDELMKGGSALKKVRGRRAGGAAGR